MNFDLSELDKLSDAKSKGSRQLPKFLSASSVSERVLSFAVVNEFWGRAACECCCNLLFCWSMVVECRSSVINDCWSVCCRLR